MPLEAARGVVRASRSLAHLLAETGDDEAPRELLVEAPLEHPQRRAPRARPWGDRIPVERGLDVDMTSIAVTGRNGR